jgi:type II secretory pathway predicted ATPase ExeA
MAGSQNAVSVSTLRRLYREHGLDRVALRSGDGRVRLRWQADRVDALWHADVCHGPAMKIAGRTLPLRVHAILDDHSRYIVAIVATTTEREIEMLALLVKAMRVTGRLPEAFYAISTHVAELGTGNVHPVLLIDEAHLLHQDVLEHLRIIANYEWDSKALLSIILVGLPETRQRLGLAKNRSFWSRIHTRLSLGEATPGDTAEYIAHRLRRAGCERDLFNSDATALIHEQSQGRLRDTDRIATDALKLGARRKIKTIDRELVARVLGDSDLFSDD